MLRVVRVVGATFLLLQVPRQAYEDDVKMSYSISPVSQSTKLLSKPSKAKRKIPKIPFKARVPYIVVVRYVRVWR